MRPKQLETWLRNGERQRRITSKKKRGREGKKNKKECEWRKSFSYTQTHRIGPKDSKARRRSQETGGAAQQPLQKRGLREIAGQRSQTEDSGQLFSVFSEFRVTK